MPGRSRGGVEAGSGLNGPFRSWEHFGFPGLCSADAGEASPPHISCADTVRSPRKAEEQGRRGRAGCWTEKCDYLPQTHRRDPGARCAWAHSTHRTQGEMLCPPQHLGQILPTAREISYEVLRVGMGQKEGKKNHLDEKITFMCSH